MQGTIKVIKRSAAPGQKQKGTGFGFVVDPSGQDRFFSHSSVDGTPFDALREGDVVEFEPYEEPKGLRARHVRLIDTRCND